MKDATLLRYIVLLPLLGAIINGLLPLAKIRLSRKMVGGIACLLPIGSFVLSLWALQLLLGIKVPDEVTKLATNPRWLHDTLYTWIPAGEFHLNLAFRMDQLGAVMALVVSGVGSLIHIYSLGYMADDRSYERYFSYLNLFTFSMLLLVLGDNLVVMFIGWEGVGVCSYLLIGFWFEDTEKAKAGMKAFIVNRIGDFGFLLGIFVIFWSLAAHGQGTVVFTSIQDNIALLQKSTTLGLPTLEVAGVLLFIGAMGKSAQIPLYVWLPDAMAGPTPVSALIHAATMVTAGVYMVARMNFLYSLAPTAATFVAAVGALTALFAASIGLFQYDIKKVLAYSTVSQLGFMFIGVGVGAYSAGVFHLMTHAFFKALLFLGAGSVIVGMHHEQDIRNMGGLLKHMKITGATFIVGTLAIIGFPGLSGFFSKDEILWMAAATKHPVIWALGSLAAVLTAFYMVRLVCLTFFGKLRASEEMLEHMPGGQPHESPWTMTLPLILLALLAAVGGYIGIPHVLGGHNVFHHWLTPVFNAGWLSHQHGLVLQGANLEPHTFISEWGGMGVALAGMVLGAGLALYLYLGKRETLADVAERYAQPGEGGLTGLAYRTLYNKYYVDEIYDATVVHPVHQVSRKGLWPFDLAIVDGLVNLAAVLTKGVGTLLSWIQTGNVKIYLYGMAVGIVTLLGFLLVVSVSV